MYELIEPHIPKKKSAAPRYEAELQAFLKILERSDSGYIPPVSEHLNRYLAIFKVLDMKPAQSTLVRNRAEKYYHMLRREYKVGVRPDLFEDKLSPGNELRSLEYLTLVLSEDDTLREGKKRLKRYLLSPAGGQFHQRLFPHPESTTADVSQVVRNVA